jgi:hypothetical protein
MRLADDLPPRESDDGVAGQGEPLVADAVVLECPAFM